MEPTMGIGEVAERTDTPDEPQSPPVICTLDAPELPGRLQEWRDVMARVVGRASVDGGIRLELDTTTPLDQLALLMKAEQGCCSFFAFALTVDHRGVALEVRAPAEGRAMVDALFGDAGSAAGEERLALLDG